MIHFGEQFLSTAWQILAESAFWVIVSLLIGGIVHEFLPTSRFKDLMNRKGNSAMASAVVFGGCLPICSCGVIPIAVSLYKSGVRLGPVMAFAAATPIINPAAVILSLALLGPQITVAYVALGLILPFLLGLVSERWGDRRIDDCTQSIDPVQTLAEARSEPSFKRLLKGLSWGFLELGPTIGFYLGIGVLLAALITTVLPPTWVDLYLKENSGFALLAAGLLGASIYVCAVAHIPLVATLLATGAAPGIAVVFLVTGTATNLPELIALYNTIGKRTVIAYSSALIIGAAIAGIIVNAWLLPDFKPVFDPIASLNLMETGETLRFSAGLAVNLVATYALLGLAVWGSVRRLTSRFQLGFADRSDDSCCPK